MQFLVSYFNLIKELDAFRILQLWSIGKLESKLKLFLLALNYSKKKKNDKRITITVIL